MRLVKALVCEISVSYHTEAMGNAVPQLTFTSNNRNNSNRSNNRNTRKRCEICSKLTMKTTGQRQLVNVRI